MFNGTTYAGFLHHLVRAYYPEKIFLIVDNARWHRGPVVAEFLESHKKELKVFHLPPYWPELNAIEHIWHDVRLHSTHNRYFDEVQLLRKALVDRFRRIQINPKLIYGYLKPFF